MALTGKKRLFADAVLAGSTNKEAAIAAGYSPATAAQSGSRMAKDPDVAAYLSAARRAKPAAAKSRNKAGASAQAAPPLPATPFDLAKAMAHTDPKAFLLAAMNDIELDPRQRIDAAKALMPFIHAKLGEGGKKDQKNEAAKEAGKKFGSRPAPRLVHSK